VPRKIALSREVEEWRAKCPLLLWMKKRGYPGVRGRKGIIPKIVEKAGVGDRMTVYSWLYGYALPRPITMTRLRKFTGITMDQWVAWYGAAPPEATTCVSNSMQAETVGSGEP
jgi:hypothetical protein